MIHPEVQALIASTNGKHYLDKVQKLKSYPQYKLPVPFAEQNSIMLDIGSGWGRWLVAGSNKNYIPIGVDIHHHFCETCKNVLEAHGKNGYLVNADLEYLPFKPGVFDLIWSFSVIQHTHLKKLKACISSMADMLHSNGFAKLEFPNKKGIHNSVYLKEVAKEIDDYKSLCVRYYSLDEYRNLFKQHFSSVKIENHSLLGIGVLKDDLKYVSFKNKLVVSMSLAGSFITKIIPSLTNFSDSIYVIANTLQVKNLNAVSEFLKLHSENPKDNLNIVPLLKCPLSGQGLTLTQDKKFLVSRKFRYPVKNEIPILLPSAAKEINI